MHYEKDEKILYDFYRQLAYDSSVKVRKVAVENDQRLMAGISKSVIRLLQKLEQSEITFDDKFCKEIVRAKGIYFQAYLIKRRNPRCVSKKVLQCLEQLIIFVSKYEAAMIHTLRLEKMGGRRISIEKIFEKKKYLNRLSASLAVQIVIDALKAEMGKQGKDTIYISNTGKKYHKENCPYCKGRILNATASAMAEYLKLGPCKCISAKNEEKIDYNHVTAFIDESIHPTRWNESGTTGKSGSFSYIVSWGKITSEKDIREETIIAKGIEYMRETEHIERVTEAAIGKVMIALAYDYDFSGTLQIFTDNKSAVQQWTSVGKNKKLARQFESVSVNFVPREKNVIADQIGRSKMCLCIPKEVYDTIVQKCEIYDHLQEED